MKHFLINSKPYRYLYSKFISKLEGQSFSGSNEHQEYLQLQRERSLKKLRKVKNQEFLRKEYLINLTQQIISSLNPFSNIKALVVGCRDTHELDYFKLKNIKSVTAIDLFSIDKRVKVMDMHSMSFADNSFDLIYASHCLEHSNDYKKVLSEITRVCSKKGFIVIEVPINYETDEIDRFDFKSSEQLINNLKEYCGLKVLLQEDLKHGAECNFSGGEIARVIIQLKK